jgi:trimeric autotransporter adhesin
MKNLFLLIALVYSSMHSFAQNVGIGTNKPLSKLHVAGDLRVDSLGKRGSGVVIHNISGVLTSLKFTGSKADVLRGDGTFQSLNAVAADAAPYWSTSGNSGTNPDSNFIGTTDDAPLLFRVNNQKAGEIDQRNNNTSLGLLAGWAFDSTSYGNTAIGAYALQIKLKEPLTLQLDTDHWPMIQSVAATRQLEMEALEVMRLVIAIVHLEVVQ